MFKEIINGVIIEVLKDALENWFIKAFNDPETVNWIFEVFLSAFS
jgi:hypothetical protein